MTWERGGHIRHPALARGRECLGLALLEVFEEDGALEALEDRQALLHAVALCLRIANHVIHRFELFPLLFREFLCLLFGCRGGGLFGGRSARRAPNVGILQDLEGLVLLPRGGRRALVQHEQRWLESYFLT